MIDFVDDWANDVEWIAEASHPLAGSLRTRSAFLADTVKRFSEALPLGTQLRIERVLVSTHSAVVKQPPRRTDRSYIQTQGVRYMSRDSSMPSAEVEVFAVQRRRRFSAEEKQRLVHETFQPGMSVSLVARAHKVSPSLLFRWRKLSSEGSLSAVDADEEVVPASEVKALHHQIRELQRLLGKKTQENEILREAVEVAREKKWLVRSP